MNFQFGRWESAEAQKFINQVRGPIFAPQRTYAADHAERVFLVDLGGKGGLPPAAGEPPSYYNLLWKGQAISLECHYAMSNIPEGALLDMVVESIEVPAVLKDELEVIKTALPDAMAALWSGLYRGASFQVNTKFNRLTFW